LSRQSETLFRRQSVTMRAGNPIAEWRDGRVVIVPPEQIED
jgi:hypothetical protein